MAQVRQSHVPGVKLPVALACNLSFSALSPTMGRGPAPPCGVQPLQTATVARQQLCWQAAAVDDRAASGEQLGPLAGMPIAIKDNICTEGMETTAGSRFLRGYTPRYDATAVARLRAAGAVLIGKTNMDEFGMGSTTEGSAFHITRNAWSAKHVPGAHLHLLHVFTHQTFASVPCLSRYSLTQALCDKSPAADWKTALPGLCNTSDANNRPRRRVVRRQRSGRRRGPRARRPRLRHRRLNPPACALQRLRRR
jgi:Amidase